MSGVLAPALLSVALGFALAFAPHRGRLLGLLGLLIGAVAALFLPLPPGWAEAVFLACWISVVVTAAAVHLPKGMGTAVAVALGVNAGLWGGAVAALTGRPADLLIAAPFALLCLPAAWLLRTPARLGVKIAASWLIAVAALAGSVAALVPTPGYVEDHRE